MNTSNRDIGNIKTHIEGLVLGFPFDQLLNRQMPYIPDDASANGQSGTPRAREKSGILLPEHNSPGSGNIVITGPPGSGKSTLALQFAVACAVRDENSAVAAYIPLENSASEILSKARPFGWDKRLRDIRHVHPLTEMSTPSEFARALRSILTQDADTCRTCRALDGEKPVCYDCHEHVEELRSRKIQRQVLVASLSPRPLVGGDEGDEIFWTRYRQLEHLLIAAKCLREEMASDSDQDNQNFKTILPLFVIDSLNMFADRPLERVETFRLFNLFKQYETIGVFTAEVSGPTSFDSTLADVVIALTKAEDNGYAVRHFEVQKSRYLNQVNGRHPFRTASLRVEEDGRPVLTPPMPNRKPDPPRHGVVVFPSLHYTVLRTEPKQADAEATEDTSQKQCWGDSKDKWGIDALCRVLPANLEQGSVVAIEGPRGTFKKTLAATFLAKGLEAQETGLLIRLHDKPLLSRMHASMQWPAISQELMDAGFAWDQLHRVEGQDWQNLVSPQKAQISLWERNVNNEDKYSWLFEVDFKGGAILPEELINVIFDIVIRLPFPTDGEKEPIIPRISRIVLDDVSEIGPGYPFLRRSSTSGEMFLPALAHMMRNCGIDFVVTGTTELLPESNDAVGRICAVADTVVSCRSCDVFGKRHVILQGEGLVVSSDLSNDGLGASVPPVVLNMPDDHNEERNNIRAFRVEPDYLEGLVGFEKGRVYRPGISMHVFEQNETIHRVYNQELDLMLRAAYGTGVSRGSSQSGSVPSHAGGSPAGTSSVEPPYAARDVSILPFNSDDSEAIHDSLMLLKGKPIERTVILTVDEFGLPQTDQDRNRFVPFSVSGLVDRQKDEERQETERNKEENIEEMTTDLGLLIKETSDLLVPRSNGEKAYLWPYYSNVLLLAYRRDYLDTLQSVSWSRVYEETLRGNLGCLRSSDHWQRLWNPAVRKLSNRRFWYDRSASETLSCMLLDALIAAYPKPDGHEGPLTAEMYNDILKRSNASGSRPNRLSDEQISQLSGLYRLLQLAGPLREEDERRFARVLPDNAGVYLCWYSQLRELITRDPSLAGKFKVCPLPGGGFTGNWFLGIVNGSVSPALGRRIIEMACSKAEDYKRFSRGVGLPTRHCFRNRDYFAWHRGRHVTLDNVLDIHAAANSRASIPHYPKIRSTLFTVAHQLTPSLGVARLKDEEIAEMIESVIGRVFEQVEVVTP